MGRLLAYAFEMVMAFVAAEFLSRVWTHLFGAPRTRFGIHGHGATPDERPEAYGGKTARDPVCGMFVSTEVSHRLKQGNETLHFCSQECLERYQKDHAHVQG